MSFTEKQKSFLMTATDRYGEGAIVSKSDIAEVADDNGMKFPFWLTDARRHGSYTKVDSDKFEIRKLQDQLSSYEARSNSFL